MTSGGISQRYAHALVDVLALPDAGQDAGTDSHAALAGLTRFVETLQSSRDLELILLSPSVPAERKRAVLGWVADHLQLHPMVRNFLFVLSNHRRMSLIREVAENALVALDERLGFLRADISAAQPLSEDELQQITDKLGAITGKKIRLQTTVAPELIGGVVARVGSTVYDGSIRGRLQALSERLSVE